MKSGQTRRWDRTDMKNLYVWRNTKAGRQLFMRFENMLVPVDSERVSDRLTLGERTSIRIPTRFWDHPNARPRIATPAAIDYAWSRQLAPRDQSDRGTCVCFALLAAIELYMIRRGTQIDLSEQYANWLFMQLEAHPKNWCQSGLRLADGLHRISEFGICTEDLWPYTSYPAKTAQCDIGPSSEAFQQARYGISKYFFIDRLTPFNARCTTTPVLDGPGIANTAYLECILAQNYDIVISVDWCIADPKALVHDVGRLPVNKNGDCCCVISAEGAHALVVVGYNRTGAKPYFICRNSNADRNPDGHIFLSYDYVRTYANYGIVVLGVSEEMPIRKPAL